MKKTAITTRVLSSHFFLGSLDEELAALAEQGPKATGELEALIRKKLAAKDIIWPSDDIGRAALVHFLLSRNDLWTKKFRHRWASNGIKPSRLTIDSPTAGRR